MYFRIIQNAFDCFKQPLYVGRYKVTWKFCYTKAAKLEIMFSLQIIYPRTMVLKHGFSLWLSNAVRWKAYQKLFRQQGGVHLQLVYQDSCNVRQFLVTLSSIIHRDICNVSVSEERILRTPSAVHGQEVDREEYSKTVMSYLSKWERIHALSGSPRESK